MWMTILSLRTSQAAASNARNDRHVAMSGIFPPAGRQDPARPRQSSQAEREYLWFCLEFCNLILERRPAHAEALQAAAEHFTALGYYQDGLALDRRLACLYPDDPTVAYNLSCSLALTGRREEALEQLSVAVAKGYRDFNAIREDRDLSSIKDEPRFREILLEASGADR